VLQAREQRAARKEEIIAIIKARLRQVHSLKLC
jgi:hypothetical protein